MAKNLGESPAAFGAQAVAKGRIGGELREGFSHAPNVKWPNQAARNAGKDDFPSTVDVVANHRFTGDEGLGQHSGEPLAKARMDHNVHRPQELGHSLGRHQPREVKMSFQAGLGDLPSQAVAQDPVPHEKKTDIGQPPDHPPGGLDDVGMPFQVKKPGHFSDNGVLGQIPQFLANLRGAKPIPGRARSPYRCKWW